jgi:hypothetical protein
VAAEVQRNGSFIGCSLKVERVMKTDIDKSTEEELTDLNHRVVARLRFLNQM